MPETTLEHLFELHLLNRLTTAERETFSRLLAMPEQETLVKKLIEEHAAKVPHYPMQEGAAAEILAAILAVPLPARAVVKMRQRQWWWAAASILLLLTAGGGYLYLHKNGPATTVQTSQPAPDIAPGGYKATLTLADGTVVTLDSNGNQALSQGATAIRQRGGQLTYTTTGSGAGASLNTLTTPRGGMMRVTLADGTQVWLNAASSLRYPTTFTEEQRQVELTGEAYFEVAKDAHQPFYVKVGDKMKVEVLGTHFNINAYTDEAGIHTTLLEGSIRIVSGTEQRILQPGQQAQTGTSIFIKENTDLNQVMAWKNGIFDFTGRSLPAVLRELSRWYDITVEYEGNVPDKQYWGAVGRDLSLSQVLKGLEKAGVHFRITEDRKLIVMP